MKHGTLRVKCNCNNEFQDKTNGKGVRCATPANKSRIGGTLREVVCTVCGKQHATFTER